MKYEDLPEDVKEFVDGLKNMSSTIEYDINDAIEDGNTLEEIADEVVSRMEALEGETHWSKQFFEGYRK